MMRTSDYPYYAIVTFGGPAYGRIRSYYRSLDRAIADARELGGGSLQTVRVVGCETATEAKDADISDSGPEIVWQR